jgi:hypothetical protein
MADTDYRSEIESLHAFFVDWYTGVADSDAFDHLETVLGPDFEMVTPDGEVHDRDTILAGIRESHGSYDLGRFDIDIRNVEVIEQYGEVTLVRYEEWQDYEETTGRLSTAVFGPPRASAGERTVEWRYLQETWLDT